MPRALLLAVPDLRRSGRNRRQLSVDPEISPNNRRFNPALPRQLRRAGLLLAEAAVRLFPVRAAPISVWRRGDAASWSGLGPWQAGLGARVPGVEGTAQMQAAFMRRGQGHTVTGWARRPGQPWDGGPPMAAAWRPEGTYPSFAWRSDRKDRRA